MKRRKLLLVLVALVMSLSLMGCPSIENLPPEIVALDENGDLVKINEIVYEHPKGETFDPNVMLQNLIDSHQLMAIDYSQSFIIGKDRKYIDISDKMEVISFYAIWNDGDDANFDGVVDAADSEYYGEIKTDQDGNKIIDETKIFLVGILGVGQELNFTIVVYDDSGDSTQISGKIIIVDSTN